MPDYYDEPDDYGDDESCDCSACTGDSEYDGEEDGEPVDTCPRCESALANLDLITEMYVCDCGVTALKEREPEYPIFTKDKDHSLA